MQKYLKSAPKQKNQTEVSNRDHF